MEFPRYIFKGKESKLIHTESEMEYGWHWDVLSALDEPATSPMPPADVTPDDAPPTRKELESKAHELGLKFHPNIGNAKLAALIEKALEA
jgi:hypothetical protein